MKTVVFYQTEAFKRKRYLHNLAGFQARPLDTLKSPSKPQISKELTQWEATANFTTPVMLQKLVKK